VLIDTRVRENKILVSNSSNMGVKGEREPKAVLFEMRLICDRAVTVSSVN
jgi:hypothetical protein